MEPPITAPGGGFGAGQILVVDLVVLVVVENKVVVVDQQLEDHSQELLDHHQQGLGSRWWMVISWKPISGGGGGGGAGASGVNGTGVTKIQLSGGAGIQVPTTFRDPAQSFGAPGPTSNWITGGDNSGKYWFAGGGGGGASGNSPSAMVVLVAI